MNFDKGNEYIELLKSGLDEDEIVKKYNIDLEELYAVVAFKDQGFARTALNHFCSGCANDICFSWPHRDEAFCPARGYEPNCPLKFH